MSRPPRRSFAAPLILTVAAVPACVVATKPTNSTGPDTTAPEQRDHRDAKEHENPPGPHTNPPATRVNEYDQSWQVRLQDDGSCLAYGEVSCEPGATCNPPRPRPVVCPDGISAGDSYTLWANAGEVGCFASAPTSCPTGATCNPPPPQAIDCPQ